MDQYIQNSDEDRNYTLIFISYNTSDQAAVFIRFPETNNCYINTAGEKGVSVIDIH